MRYQFLIDGRAFGSKVRGTWAEAAQDAVNAGYASWKDHGASIRLNTDQGAEIARYDDDVTGVDRV